MKLTSISQVYSLLWFFLILLIPATATAQFLRAEGPRIVNEKGENILLRGIGLGGWMLQEGYMLRINREGQQYRIRERIEELIGPDRTREFYDLWLANHTTKADIDSMKAWGFNSVRLPMHFNLYTLPVDQEPVAGQHTWLERGFQITDSLLSWCRQNQMYLILDLHAAPGGQGNDLNISDRDPSKPSLWESEANQQKTIALWRKLAERYKNEPWIGGYDLINEPNWGFEDLNNDRNGTKEEKNIPLEKLYKDITRVIREVDQRHMIIIEGNGWGNNYRGMNPNWDNNMALSFHKYWAFNDPASANQMIRMREQYKLPVWLGETGENSNVWFTEAIRLFESNNIGWAWWPLKKIGHNNPAEIRSNPSYDQVAAYINGRQNEPRPKADDAYKGLIDLAANTRIGNTIIHHDVIDAMIRQPHSVETKPFKRHSVPGAEAIQAVNYDLGRNGYAYFDKDTADYHVSTGKGGVGNRGRVYRNDGVDIQRDSTAQNKFYVNSFEQDEWLQYTLDVSRKGNYLLKLELASDHDNGRVSILLGNKILFRSISVPNTGSMKKFAEINIGRIALAPGDQKLRVLSESGGFNLSTIRILR